MKNIVFLVLGLQLALSCAENPVPKPDTFLDESTMIDILYDTALLQAAEAYVPEKLTDNGVKIKNYIYLKYDIDSTTYYQNQRYYAADAKKYKEIYKEVLERIDNNKTEIDTLLAQETRKNLKASDRKREFTNTVETVE